MILRYFILASFGFTTFFSCKAQQLKDPPNVILKMVDDQCYGDLSFHGNSILKTPNLKERKTQLQTAFLDQEGNEICGAMYVKATREK